MSSFSCMLRTMLVHDLDQIKEPNYPVKINTDFDIFVAHFDTAKEPLPAN